ncbi:MAG: sulfatase-like hydrolase/transferase [Gammaproteobacteria bacterium]|nr:sulfatase-like hydrolase/transferase [Gammaproteobacteria bacterium]
MQKNILFIMCDQLRFDYLSCYGHEHLHTPNVDALAAKGIRFNNAYAQSPICGPSRMSFYTGRYVRSHGSTWNCTPLRIGEPTLGDHLNAIGVRNVLLGKTHMRADREGMKRLGIDCESEIGLFNAECGFEVYERDDGLHPDAYQDACPRYNQYLNDNGFDGANPWQSWANSAKGESGELLSGWLMENADKPARIPDYYSETPYLTRRAMDFIDDANDTPWCLHLSYIKPHWPYMAPAPYHNMYNSTQVQAAIRSEEETQNTHPLLNAFMQHNYSQTCSRDDFRERVIPTYMGLIKQLDDQLGLLFAHLEKRGLNEDTMIVFTSDHGDYLGDHWLGDKELFHDAAVKIPLIIFDPSKDADGTRGHTSQQLVESIDLAPTFIEYMGGRIKKNVLEGHSLLPLLHGENKPLRRYAFSELDYASSYACIQLNMASTDARAVMVRDKQYKYIYVEGMRPLLFDLQQDPQELNDLGTSEKYQNICQRFEWAILKWSLKHHNRITLTDEQIETSRGNELDEGIFIGYWDQDEVNQAMSKAGKS